MTDMTWREFKAWLVEVGWPSIPTTGLTSGDGRVLGRICEVGPVGQGQHRQYGQRYKQRVRLYMQMAAILGWPGNQDGVPGWVWVALDIGANESGGYLLVEFGGDAALVSTCQVPELCDIDWPNGALILPIPEREGARGEDA